MALHKRYIRIDAQNRIVYSFSDATEQPIEGDIQVGEADEDNYSIPIYVTGYPGVFKYKWSNGQITERTQEELQPEINAINKIKLRDFIIELQKQINACADLLTYTTINTADIIAKRDELIALRNAKIEEYNNL